MDNKCGYRKSVGCRLMTPLSVLHPRLHGDVRRFIDCHSCVPSGGIHDQPPVLVAHGVHCLEGSGRVGFVGFGFGIGLVSLRWSMLACPLKRCVDHVAIGPRSHFLPRGPTRGPQRRSSKAPEPARMVKNKGKGGKNRRRGKADGDMKRELTFKEDGQGAR